MGIKLDGLPAPDEGGWVNNLLVFVSYPFMFGLCLDNLCLTFRIHEQHGPGCNAFNGDPSFFIYTSLLISVFSK